jgi:outer membrane protein TolC
MRPRTVLALACLLVFRPLLAEDLPSPPPAAALVAAVAHAPALQAARARAEAARARTAAAGPLPSPQLEGMYSQTRRPMGGEQFPMWEVTLSQPLPKAGERAADRARAAAAVSMAEADYAVLAGEMAAEAAIALAEADAARARAELFTRQIERTGQVLSALDARLATGAGRVADRLALQTEVASLRLMLEQDARMIDDALAEARSRLGLAPDAPLPAFSAPTPAEIDPESLPSLRLAAARALARMARASARPMSSVGLRFEREEERMGNMDTLGVAFMTEIPVRSRSYARAEERAARSEEAAARADAEAARHRARSALARVARAERLAATSRRLADETSARLDAEYDSLVRSNDASVLLVLQLLERQTDTRLQIIAAEFAARAARAELWRHAPAALFATP